MQPVIPFTGVFSAPSILNPYQHKLTLLGLLVSR